MVNNTTIAIIGADVLTSINLITLLVLFILLVTKEVTSISEQAWLKTLSHTLDIVLIPIGIAFLLTVIFNLTDLLR
jgi:hypothetical protein